MFDWVPIKLYSLYFYNIMLVLSLVIIFHSMAFDIRNKRRLSELSSFGYIILVFIILYMGLRPLHSQFGDMGAYYMQFRSFQDGAKIEGSKDWLFTQFIYWSAQIMDWQTFFLLDDILYILPMYFFSKKHFKSYWFFSFFILLTSFSFFTYGTNGLRNGLGTSFFLWGLVYYKDNKNLMYVFFLMAYLMHGSLIIAISAFVIAFFLIDKPKVTLGIWLASIPVSLVGGGFWNAFIEGLGLFEDRSSGYLIGSEKTMEQFSQTGFRWDFIIYSAVPIFAAWYFAIDRKLNDKFYMHLFGTYAIANAFWILLIRSAFSNRFAYLSWFLMAPIIIYPLCKYEIIKNQYRTIGIIIFLYFFFTYFMLAMK